jgi:hypothetical protein
VTEQDLVFELNKPNLIEPATEVFGIVTLFYMAILPLAAEIENSTQMCA